ncbi:MAG: A/G-specific adenine glycosylase [Deltaproteobacteria bacterium]|nr:A/G-specific adenine glycosylase [Deltaproteobacteria bacterium]
MSLAPADLRQMQHALLKWYDANQRKLPWRRNNDPYGIWVSEVMLQQTRVNSVLPYYAAFMDRFPTIEALARADLGEVLKTWEGLGYYARARNLHKAARMVTWDLGGRIPENWTDFKKMPGVGEYIASAVQSIAFDHTHAVVDGNVKRVLARLFLMEEAVNEAGSYQAFKRRATVLMKGAKPGTFNQAVMELGSLICTPTNPACGGCCLRTHCQGLKTRQVKDYPKRTPSKAVPTRHVAAGVVWKKGRVLITRRTPKGLLGGLWEFPGGQVKDEEDAPSACMREIREETGLEVNIHSHLVRVKHAYTHFKIHMDVFHCQYVSGRIRLNGPEDFRWIRLKEIRQYPFPKANLKFIPLLTEDPAISEP